LSACHEAVDLYRDAHLPDLAGALVNLAKALSQMGQHEQALVSSQETPRPGAHVHSRIRGYPPHAGRQ
jgi:hypothetical protein